MGEVKFPTGGIGGYLKPEDFNWHHWLGTKHLDSIQVYAGGNYLYFFGGDDYAVAREGFKNNTFNMGRGNDTVEFELHTSGVANGNLGEDGIYIHAKPNQISVGDVNGDNFTVTIKNGNETNEIEVNSFENVYLVTTEFYDFVPTRLSAREFIKKYRE